MMWLLMEVAGLILTCSGLNFLLIIQPNKAKLTTCHRADPFSPKTYCENNPRSNQGKKKIPYWIIILKWARPSRVHVVRYKIIPSDLCRRLGFQKPMVLSNPEQVIGISCASQYICLAYLYFKAVNSESKYLFIFRYIYIFLF